MMESFKICQVVHQGTEYTLRPVDSVPADSVCILYVGGNGMVHEDRIKNTGQIIDKEILRYVADIPCYVIMYDSLTVAENRGERLTEISKKGFDVLPRIGVSSVVYLNIKNVKDVYSRHILPLFMSEGPRGFGRISFVIDGNRDEIMSYVVNQLDYAMRQLHFTNNTIIATKNMVLSHAYPYSDYIPPYPREMFDQVLLPRISDGHGHRVDIDTALRRVRKLNLFAQCHGAHVVRMMEQVMTETMAQMGYSKDEIKQVQSQLLVTAYAPACILGDSKFQFISFISAYDYIADMPNNWVFEYISANRLAEAERYMKRAPNWEWVLPPMFLGGRNGNVFIVKQRFKTNHGPDELNTHEHNDQHFLPLDATEDGILLGMLSRNVVINGIKNSLAQGGRFVPLPPIQELVLDEPGNENIRGIFNDMTLNGQDFMLYVYEFAKEHNPEIHIPRDIKHSLILKSKNR